MTHLIYTGETEKTFTLKSIDARSEWRKIIANPGEIWKVGKHIPVDIAKTAAREYKAFFRLEEREGDTAEYIVDRLDELKVEFNLTNQEFLDIISNYEKQLVDTEKPEKTGSGRKKKKTS